MLSTRRLSRTLNNARSSLPTSIPVNNIVKSRKLSSIPDGQAQTGATNRPTDISAWTKEQVTSWLLNVQPLDDNNKRVWESLQATGKSLKGISQEMLEKHGMPYGPAFEVVSQIHKLVGLAQLGSRDWSGKPPKTGQELLDFVLANPELQGHFKQDFTKPVKLSYNKASFVRVARQDTLRDAYAAMTTRLHLRSIPRKEESHDRLSNPLPAMWATTGGGKTRGIDELAALRPEDLELCQDEAMRKILENSVAVPITYNGATQFNPIIDDNIDNHGLGLAVRALYSYFCGRDNMRFSDFIQALKDVLPVLTLERAVQCISAHSKKGVLLLVDELMKSAALAERIKLRHVVSRLGDCLDNFSPSGFNIVVTTLNSVAFKNETESGRRIIWIRLRPATFKEGIFLFLDDHAKTSLGIHPEMRPAEVFQRLAELDVDSLLQVLNNPVLAQCIADCIGHFRIMEDLKMLWKKPESKRDSYATLTSNLGRAIDPKYRSLTLPLLKAALLGAPVAPTEIVPGETATFGAFIQDGTLLNTPGNSTNSGYLDASKSKPETDSILYDTPEKFVPRVSPLQLLLFAHANITHKFREEYVYASVIKSMLDLEPNFNWQQYEKFHAHWENLVRLVHGDRLHTITSLYGGELKTGSPNPSFYPSAMSPDLYYWPTDFPSEKSKPVPDFRPGTLSQSTILPATNNPGFDIVRFETRRADDKYKLEPIVICTECRFSDPTAKTYLSKGEVQEKHALTVKQFHPYFAKGATLDGFTLKEDNLFLVVCAFRNVRKNALDDKELPPNTIVLDRDRLKALYTPSLASRPQFMLPLKHGELTQVLE
jgi:hypothetical protein